MPHTASRVYASSRRVEPWVTVLGCFFAAGVALGAAAQLVLAGLGRLAGWRPRR